MIMKISMARFKIASGIFENLNGYMQVTYSNYLNLKLNNKN